MKHKTWTIEDLEELLGQLKLADPDYKSREIWLDTGRDCEPMTGSNRNLASNRLYLINVA